MDQSIHTLFVDWVVLPDPQPVEDYVSHPRWTLVVERARAALCAMVLAGPIEPSEG